MDQLRIDPTLVFAAAVGEENGIGRAGIDALAAQAGKRAAAGARSDADVADGGRAATAAAADEIIDPVLDFVASSHGRFRAVVVLASPSEAVRVRAIHSALVSPYAESSSAMLPRLLVFDEADPDVMGEFLDVFDASECLFVVAATDGDAVMPQAPFRIVREEVRRKLGDEAHKDHFVFAREPAAGELREIARADGYAMLGPSAGQGSARSSGTWIGATALLSSALVGVDVKGLVAGASAMEETCAGGGWESNPALLLACVHELFARRKRRLLASACGRRLRDATTCLHAEGFDGESCRPADLEPRRHDMHGRWIGLLGVDEADHKLDVPADDTHAKLARASLNELFVGEGERLRQSLAARGCPSLTVHFPCVNAHTMGQFLALVRRAGRLRQELRQEQASS